jgi:hypothetical protein
MTVWWVTFGFCLLCYWNVPFSPTSWQLWSTLREPPAQQTVTLSRSRWPRTSRLQIMLAMPYVVFAVFIAITALVSDWDPFAKPVQFLITGRTIHYDLFSFSVGMTFRLVLGTACIVRLRVNQCKPFIWTGSRKQSLMTWTCHRMDYAVPGFCTTILVIIIGFESESPTRSSMAVVHLTKRLAAIAIRYLRMQRTISDNFPLADTKKSPAMVIRVLAFSIYTLITLRYVASSLDWKLLSDLTETNCSAGILFLSHIEWAWPYMVQAGCKSFLTWCYRHPKNDCCSASLWIFCLRNTEGKLQSLTLG